MVSFIYDDLGNHLTQDDNGTTTVGLFNAVNEQTKRGAPGSEVAVLYDARGNLTKDDSGKAYYYDRQNMLTRVDDSSGNLLISYQYDAFNRLVSKEAVGWPSGVSFVYDGWRRLEEHPGGEPVADYCYIWTPGRAGYIDDLICYIRSPADSNITYFACRNHNFSVTAMLTSGGAVIERYDYNPYGERIVLDPDYAADADGISDIINPVGFQGLVHDDETGLIYVRNRYLKPTLGMWMTRDPLGYPDGMNVYQYLASHPNMALDPSGLYEVSILWNQKFTRFGKELGEVQFSVQVSMDCPSSIMIHDAKATWIKDMNGFFLKWHIGILAEEWEEDSRMGVCAPHDAEQYVATPCKGKLKRWRARAVISWNASSNPHWIISAGTVFSGQKGPGVLSTAITVNVEDMVGGVKLDIPIGVEAWCSCCNVCKKKTGKIYNTSDPRIEKI